MRELMLIIHFIGLSMGLGTSFAYMFLGFIGAKMEKSERDDFFRKLSPLQRMGQIGLVIVVVSGLYLITPFWKVLGESPFLIIKLILVTFLAGLLGAISSTMKKAHASEIDLYFNKIELMGKIAMLTTLTIVVMAVMNFR